MTARASVGLRRVLVAATLVSTAVPALAHEVEDPAPEEAPSTQPAGPIAPPWTMLRFEAGLVDDRTSIGALEGHHDGALYSGSLPVGGRVDARSVVLRVLFGHLGRYGGMEMSVGWLRQAPPVFGRPDPALEDHYIAEGRPLGDSMFTARLLGGVEERIAHVVVGAELALGAAGVTVGGTDPGEPHVAEPRFVLDARARLGVWLSPHVTATLLLGTSLVRDGDHTAGLMLGLTPVAFDNL